MTIYAMPKYFVLSLCIHAFVLIILILNINFSTPLPVFENTNQHDVISAVILGDVQTSKLLPQQAIVQPKLKLPLDKELTKKEIVESIPVKKNVISLKVIEKNREMMREDLLADIKKQSKKQKQLHQKKLQGQNEKMLRLQAEKSLRQQFMNDDIKVKGTQTRHSQGEINKYKALIL